MTIEQTLNDLWGKYLKEVPYASMYMDYLKKNNGELVWDHVAFRTIDETGYFDKIEDFFVSHGYEFKETYEFKEKKLIAHYLKPPTKDLPRVFISTFSIYNMRPSIYRLIKQIISTQEDVNIELKFEPLKFKRLPTLEEFRQIESESEYAAWVLAFGNKVNHFTSFVNKDKIYKPYYIYCSSSDPDWIDKAKHKNSLDEFEWLVEELQKFGIPMKGNIEGEPHSKLRQTSTKACKLPVQLADCTIEYPYAYMEFAKRGYVLFDGFITDQAKELFKMTDKDAK